MNVDSDEQMWFIVFCKQKTAYEVRISDWSSDVCSSDLERTLPRHARLVLIGDFLDPLEQWYAAMRFHTAQGARGHLVQVLDPAEEDLPFTGRTRLDRKSRRVGKAGVRTIRSRWSPSHYKKTSTK